MSNRGEQEIIAAEQTSKNGAMHSSQLTASDEQPFGLTRTHWDARCINELLAKIGPTLSVFLAIPAIVAITSHTVSFEARTRGPETAGMANSPVYYQ
jgi:hypothetical protein